MSGQYVASRFGQDSPTRIAASASVLLESSAFLPGEPYVPALIPFYQSNIYSGSSGGSSGYSLTADGNQLWQVFPSRLDLEYYQGDDISVTLYLLSDEDMSAWTWECQVRDYHNYQAPLIYEFDVEATFIPATETDPAMTRLTLSLPRTENTVIGYNAWELYSVSDQDVLKTWMFGLVHVIRRGSTTDVLPPPDTGDGGGTVPEGWNGGWFVGPNGRVP